MALIRINSLMMVTLGALSDEIGFLRNASLYNAVDHINNTEMVDGVSYYGRPEDICGYDRRHEKFVGPCFCPDGQNKFAQYSPDVGYMVCAPLCDPTSPAAPQGTATTPFCSDILHRCLLDCSSEPCAPGAVCISYSAFGETGKACMYVI
ncbi:hypothetical protein FOL47_010585 [Perkinsus chesapeaki]|uniref:Uncharacterized protein n=1 Tax=Perkinsus chesapeaki TaxID=330153 RepID=A0A7J6MPB3_PERCH|nr:hypothetical protein FOL47_010585 [Perkinsus chesapeaki]